MNIEDLTIRDLKTLRGLLSDAAPSQETPFPYSEGEQVLIRTVTVYHVGVVQAIKGGFIHLNHASWVADTGRFSEAIAKGFPSSAELEYVGAVAVASQAVVDVFPWTHDLPQP